MKIKPQHLVLVGLFLVFGVIGILFFGPKNMGYLFSRSVDGIVDITLEGADPRPAIESLDGLLNDEASEEDIAQRITELQKELIETQNDPDKAMELRRRIQLLQVRMNTPSSTQADNS